MVRTGKPRREADVDTLLAKVMKRTAECGEQIDMRLNAGHTAREMEPSGEGFSS